MTFPAGWNVGGTNRAPGRTPSCRLWRKCSVSTASSQGRCIQHGQGTAPPPEMREASVTPTGVCWHSQLPAREDPSPLLPAQLADLEPRQHSSLYLCLCIYLYVYASVCVCRVCVCNTGGRQLLPQGKDAPVESPWTWSLSTGLTLATLGQSPEPPVALL